MITAQIEDFEASLSQLKPLFALHHAELALFQARMPLAPQYGEYVMRERTGTLLLATVRVDGNIAAYYTVQLAPGFHYCNTMTAHMDLCYIAQQYRNRGLALPLFRCVEKELKRRGVQIWYSGYKTHNDLRMPALLELLNFRSADTYMVKWIDS